MDETFVSVIWWDLLEHVSGDGDIYTLEFLA